MHTEKNDDQHELPPIAEFIKTRPNSWLGRPLTWLTPEEPPKAVFLQKFLIPRGQRAAYLYGAKYDLSQVLVGGESYAPGFFEEYFVVTGEPGQWSTHRLLQREGMTFSETDEKDDCIRVKELPPDAVAGPKWKASAAEWPIALGHLMTFVGQVTLPDTEEMRALLTCNLSVFLFWSEVDSRDCFKIVTQYLNLQTEEDHDRIVEARWAEQAAKKKKRPPRTKTSNKIRH